MTTDKSSSDTPDNKPKAKPDEASDNIVHLSRYRKESLHFNTLINKPNANPGNRGPKTKMEDFGLNLEKK